MEGTGNLHQNQISMSRYITRIQLQGASALDVEKLNNEMSNELFTLNNEYTLSERSNISQVVEYAWEGNRSLTDITGAAYRAARKAGKVCSFTVIRQKNIAGYPKK